MTRKIDIALKKIQIIFMKYLSPSENIQPLKEGLMELGLCHFEDIILPEPLFDKSSVLDQKLEWIGRKIEAFNKVAQSLTVLFFWVMVTLFPLTILLKLKG